MSLPQKKFREIVFQILYSKDMGEISEDGLIQILSKELATTKKNIRLAHESALKISEKFSELDSYIKKTCASYSFERIRSVERNVLRMGVYEILFDDSIPPKVAISEAIRIAKKFSTPEAATFVNAVLDAIYKASLGETIDTTSLSAFAEHVHESEISEPPKGADQIQVDLEEED